MAWGGKWKGGLGWGTHVNPWLIHANVWQKPPLQYCKVISLQLIKINEKNKHLKILKNQLLLQIDTCTNFYIYTFLGKTNLYFQMDCFMTVIWIMNKA